MKKIIASVMLILFGFGLIGCSDNSLLDEISNHVAIQYQGTDNAYNVTQDITLPSLIDVEEFVDAEISWKSGNEAVIKIEGNKGKVTRPSADTEVTLTFKISFQGQEKEFDYVVTVIKKGGSSGNPGGENPGGEESLVMHFENSGSNLTSSFSTMVGSPTLTLKYPENATYSIDGSRRVAKNDSDNNIKMSGYDKRSGTDNKDAYLLLSFDEEISKLSLKAKAWSAADLSNLTDFRLEVKAGSSWTSVKDLLGDLTDAENTFDITGLDSDEYRLYLKGNEPSGNFEGNNSSRIVLTMIKAYVTGGSSENPGGNTDNPGGNTDNPGGNTDNPGAGSDELTGTLKYKLNFVGLSLGSGYISKTLTLTSSVTSASFSIEVKRTNSDQSDGTTVLSATGKTTSGCDGEAYLAVTAPEAVSSIVVKIRAHVNEHVDDRTAIDHVKVQQYVGGAWVDVKDITSIIGGLDYTTLTISGLTSAQFRIYVKGVEAISSANQNTARVRIDNIAIYC